MSAIIPFYNQIDQFIEKGKGCYLFDREGKRYVDFESGDWAAILGHSNRRFTRALKKQANVSVHDGLRFKNRWSDELSALLLDKFSFNGGKSVFLSSGSEAVNLAIILAKSLTGRQKVLKLSGSYLSAYGHGHISGQNIDLINIGYEDYHRIKELDFGQIAAFVFEPGNCGGLVKFPSLNFINTLDRYLKKNGVLLIANEVTTGFGRTGKWFGFQYYEIKPDIVAMGKALGNGYPISAVCVCKHVSELFGTSPFRYAQSHQNDPLGCAVGIEVVKTIEDEDLVRMSFDKGNNILIKLRLLQEKHKTKVTEIRGRGLMVAIELNENIDNLQINNKLLQNGLITGCKENVIRLMPPFKIGFVHLNLLVDNLDKIFSDM